MTTNCRKQSHEHAVSPVVGVMLMLVVVIIIAAVVSGFSGGLIGNTKKAPTLSMDVHISNNGYWPGTHFSATVTGVERGVSTKDLKLVTSYSLTNSAGKHITGGAIMLPGVNNTHMHLSPGQGCGSEGDYFAIAPIGFGTGIGDKGGSSGSKQGISKSGTSNAYFGNYDLTVGTTMWAQPYGETARPTGGGYTSTSYNVGFGVNGSQWSYKTGTGTGNSSYCAQYIAPTVNSLPTDTALGDYSVGTFDTMTAVLGMNWTYLRAGDSVKVTMIHIPSGKTIWEKDVIVED